MVLLITYDLHKPDRDYADVETAIKTARSCVHLEESVWLIETSDSPATWRDRLNDAAAEATYFVVRLQHSWAALGLATGAVDWLKDGRDW